MPTPLAAATLDAVADGIAVWLAGHAGEPLVDVLDWTLCPPGKLVRPALLLESAAAVGGSYEQVLPAAVGVGLAHSGSLAHDDLIDGDDLRRGRPAVHRRFDAASAVLSGDALFFALFQQVGECRRRGVPDEAVAEAMEILAEAGRQAACGVARELAWSGGGEGAMGDDPVGGYLETARLKTAVLLRAACQTGAVLGGGDGGQRDALRRFGEALGIAFQIRDDLLPYEPGPRGWASGDKPADSDLRNRRPALPVLLARRLASPAERESINALLAGPFPERGSDGRQERLCRLVWETGAVREAHRMAREQVERCRAALAVLPSGEHRDRLGEFAELLGETSPPVAEPARGEVVAVPPA
ncbi:polyprenyl synthetase family protein [Streptomyces alkaliterrae]|uniref:Polyprenyl synthetase family protein n=2 Tax=Streptomyces alkaliterrae TaxID=2213162 RepID=A0A7W3X0T3_9ACTN|nr:polyprenyl synthetase family protein [Streptomyces alkaliterrae]MBB1262082.1 polyprenyl synthetase family protein [Streptomyces alkaliterrae]